MTTQYKLTIRDRDLPVWEKAKQEAEREYIPFSRFLVKVLEERLEGRCKSAKGDNE